MVCVGLTDNPCDHESDDPLCPCCQLIVEIGDIIAGIILRSGRARALELLT